MGGSFEQQMMSLKDDALNVLGEVINVPTRGNGGTQRGRTNTRRGSSGNAMTRPDMTAADTIEYQRQHQSAQAQLRAAGGYGSDRERMWADSMQRQQAALGAMGAGGGGGGGLGGGGAASVSLDPKFAAGVVGAILLLLYFAKKRKKAA